MEILFVNQGKLLLLLLVVVVVVVETKEMVAKDSPTFKSLTKQGYTIVGSHSGVKYVVGLKVPLEEEGSCYKFAFMVLNLIYVWKLLHLWHVLINVFCWRHGTNPVAKLNWRWEVDPPEKSWRVPWKVIIKN